MIFEHFQCFRSIVEISFLIVIKKIITQTRTEYFAYSIFINNNICWIESIMQNLIFTKMRHGKHTTAKYWHYLFVWKLFIGVNSVFDFISNCVTLILIKFKQSILFGADGTLSYYLMIECAEIELMGQWQITFVSFHVFCELLLGGECSFDDYGLFFRVAIDHKRLAFSYWSERFVIF